MVDIIVVIITIVAFILSWMTMFKVGFRNGYQARKSEENDSIDDLLKEHDIILKELARYRRNYWSAMVWIDNMYKDKEVKENESNG